MEQGVWILNRMTAEVAARALHRCCASSAWSAALVADRPYRSIDHLHEVARDAWWSLGENDWLEAFAAHPKISDRGAPTTTGDAKWSEDEQSGTRDAPAEIKTRFARANASYEAKFGFIFIICATGKDASEMLEALEDRLSNTQSTEIRIAAEQQMYITEIRLNKLLSELETNG